MDVRLTIGELARWAGTTTRSVRHYHRVGVLPEPARTPGGYRAYGLGDLARLVRARRLVALGMPLARVGELLDDDADLAVALADLDADLERREAELRRSRATIRDLLDGGTAAAARVERLRADLVAVFGSTPLVERELALLEVLAHDAPDAVPALEGIYRGVLADEASRAASAALAAAFDELAAAERAGRDVADLVDGVAARLAALVTEAAARVTVDRDADLRERSGADGGSSSPDSSSAASSSGGWSLAGFEALVAAELTPAQAAALRRARELLRELS